MSDKRGKIHRIKGCLFVCLCYVKYYVLSLALSVSIISCEFVCVCGFGVMCDWVFSV